MQNVPKGLKEKHTLQNPLLSPESLACTCLGTFPTRVHYSFCKCFKCLLGLWDSTMVLVPCTSYFKPWLRSQVSLRGLFPRNIPDSGHLAAWTHQAPECPGVTKEEIVKVKWRFSKSRYCLWCFCSTVYLDIKATCLSRRCVTAPQKTSHQGNIGDKEPMCNLIQWHRLCVIRLSFWLQNKWI